MADPSNYPTETLKRTVSDHDRNEKRSIDAVEPSGSGDDKTSEPRKRLKLFLSTNKSKSALEVPVNLDDGRQKKQISEHRRATGTEEELPDPAAAESQQKSAETLPTISKLAREADAVKDSARKPSISDLNEGKKKVALQNVRASYSASLCDAAMQQPQDNASTREATIYDLFPPELPPSGKTNTKVRQEIINQVLSGIQRTMEGLCRKSKAIFLNFAMDNSFEHRVPAKLVENPSPVLAALYTRVFGTEEWYSEFTRRTLNQSEPWLLAAADMVASIISAAVFEDVFCARQPWDITGRIKAAVGTEMKYLQEAIDDKGHSWDEVCKQTLYKMVNDKEFQDTTIAKHARFLAAKLTTTIAPHLRMHRGDSGDDQPGLGPLYAKMIEELFQRTLIAKGKMDSYWEARYEYIWPKSGTMMDPEMCMPMPGQGSTTQKIMLTFWPAVRVTSHTYNGGDDDVYYAYQSEVITTNNLE